MIKFHLYALFNPIGLRLANEKHLNNERESFEILNILEENLETKIMYCFLLAIILVSSKIEF